MKKFPIVFISIFFAVVAVFFTSYLVFPSRAFSDDENRELSQMPEFSVDNLFSGKFTTKFETHIADQFLFRPFWIAVKSNIQIALQYKEIKGVYIAKDDYLIQKLPSQDAVSDTFVSNLETLSNKYTNLDFYTSIVPSTATVLSDKLPKSVNIFNEKVIFDKFDKAFDSNNIDVCNALKTKKDEYIYFKTDHHWTSLGAYYGYEAITKKLNIEPLALTSFDNELATDEFYGTMYSKGCFSFAKPDTIELFKSKRPLDVKVTIPETKTVRDDMFFLENLKKKDKYTVFLGENRKLITINTNIANGKTLTILKDSYANALIPFLASHYETINIVDLRFFTDDLSTIIDVNKKQDVLALYNTLSVITDKTIAEAFLKL